MSYIAVVRMQNGKLLAIQNDESLAEWPTYEQADDAMANHILAPLGIELVEVQS